MKQYSGNLEEMSAAMLQDLSSDLTNSKVTSRILGVGTITNVNKLGTVNAGDFDIFVTIDFEGIEKKFALFSAISNNFINIDDSVNDCLLDYTDAFDALNEANKERKRQSVADDVAAFEASEKAKKEDAHIKRMKNKAEMQKIAANNKAKKLSNTTFSTYANFYRDLGYVAKHVKKISAAIPDYLEKWFESEFGDAEKYVADTSKKTPSGIPPQFSIAIKIELDTNENIPKTLENMLSSETKNIKSISNTEYGFSLCKEYGFKFGKEQDLEEIRSHVPAYEMQNFEFGYNLV